MADKKSEAAANGGDDKESGARAKGAEPAGKGGSKMLLIVGVVVVIGGVGAVYKLKPELLGIHPKTEVKKKVPSIRDTAMQAQLWIANMRQDSLQTEIQSWIAQGGVLRETGGGG
ncbi:MAG: hypothetical protein HQL58_07935 [Magnetococcales bacterium]|nr:hypothetical protein [Magnetococcales bacterium]